MKLFNGLLLKLSWRNALRNRKRYFFAFLLFTSATFLFYFYASLMSGAFNSSVDLIVWGKSAPVRLYSANATFEDETLSLSHFLDPATFGEVKSFLSSKGLAFTPVVETGVLVISSAPNEGGPLKVLSMPSLLRGIDPSTYFEVFKNIKRFNITEDDAVVDSKLANALDLKKGDRVFVASGRKLIEVRVGMIVPSLSMYTGAGIFVHIKKAQKLIGAPLVSWVAFVPENFKTGLFFRGILPDLPESLRGKVKFLTWVDLNEDFVSLLSMKVKYAVVLLLMPILFLSSIAVANVLFMLVYERKKEIGVLLSFGAGRTHVAASFVLEGVFVAVAGLVAGSVAGLLIVYLLSVKGIDMRIFTGGKDIDFGIPFEPVIKGSLDPSVVAVFLISLLLIAALSSSIPAYFASKLSPAEAMRE